jgi:hypothetical protein
VKTAVEGLQWRFASYEQVTAACAAGGISPLRFLSFRPEKLRLRVGESFLRSHVPVIFADDLADRLGALLPGETPPAVAALAPDKDTLRRQLALAQLDSDLDIRDVTGWGGLDAFVTATTGLLQRFFDEARSAGAGEETAAFFQLVASSSLRNVLAHKVGTGERFLGLSALLSHLTERALAATVDAAGQGLSARLGLLLMAATSPLSLMGVADAVAARPGNVYRTVPAALERARELVRGGVDRPGGLDLPVMRARLAAELLSEPARQRDVLRTLVAEAVRDLALLSTLTQGSELRDLASQSGVLVDALFSPLGQEKLRTRLQRHPRAGQEPLIRLQLLVDSVGAILAGDQAPLSRIGSLEERADLAAAGALVLALDEVALERGGDALAMVRPVPAEEADKARKDGKAYRFSLDDEPLFLLPQRRDEAFLFVDMKDFTKRTAAIRESAMGDFLKSHFYEPILRQCAHLARHAAARCSVVNLLGDAIATRGDVVSHVALATACRRLLDEAARELREAEQALAAGGDEVLVDIDREIARTKAGLTSSLTTSLSSSERAALEAHLQQLQAGRDERVQQQIGSGLEAGVFVSFGREATVIEVGFPEVGDWNVVIAEQLNAAARGTSRSASLARERSARRQQHETALGRHFIDPFHVHTDADPQAVQPTTEFHNAGAALTGEALAAWQAATTTTLSFHRYEVPRGSLPPSLQKYWLPRDVERYVLVRERTGAATHLLQWSGRTVFRGLEKLGPLDIWEMLLVDRGFGLDFATAVRA